jgi:signal transduction histidine kinase
MAIAFNILGPALLFLYLSSPGLQRTFKSLYLPIGIAWAVVAPILDSYINLHVTGDNVPEILAYGILWRQIVLLLIPLVVVSWQYTMRQVVLFCVLAAMLNITLLLSQALTFQEMISSSLLDSLLHIIATQTIIFLLVGYTIVNLMKVQRGQRQCLTDANDRLAQHASTLEQLTISRERNRLARELHDILAHTLSGVAIELEGVRSMLRLDLERANVLLGHALQTIRDGLTETRRALKDLRAKPLEDLGLALAVRALAESCTGRFGFRIDLNIDPDLGDYPDEVQQCVYRIAQEALANIADHAQAQNAQVILKRDRNQLQLFIRDDGCGFNWNGAQGVSESSHPGFSTEEYQYGLLGMRERTEMIGGYLAVESQVGQGTQVCFLYGGDQ